MLVVSRSKGEKIVIHVGSKRIEVMLVNVGGHKARIGIEADRDVIIDREEVDSAKTHERSKANAENVVSGASVAC